MGPNLLLHVLAAFAGYLFKTTSAFLLCLILTRLLRSANLRLMVWLSFLAGAAVFWFSSGFDLLPLHSAVTEASGSAASAPGSALTAWHLPRSWAVSMGMAARAAGFFYVTAIAYFFLLQVKMWARLRWVLRFATAAPNDIESAGQSLATGLGIRQPRLLILSGLTSPATFGWLRPTVLLPDTCSEQDPADLERILLHELHHIRRWDFAWNRLAMFARIPLFFHPASWYAARQVAFECEVACDQAAGGQTPEQRANYAECLLRFARQAPRLAAWGVDFAGESNLSTRVHLILAGPAKTSVASICWKTVCGVAVVGALITILGSRPVLFAYEETLKNNAEIVQGAVEATHVVKRKEETKRVHGVTQILAQKSSLATDSVDREPALPALTEAIAQTRANTDTPPGGPQLKRRDGSESPARVVTGQTIALLDPGTTKTTEDDMNRKQDLEQTAATLLGALRRIGDGDRH
jgi:beta-lactamase regulating signal transducer with metallopeptidase domain